jgi:hypothetical protein
MNPSYTAVVKHDGDWWIGWVEEVPGVTKPKQSIRTSGGSVTDRRMVKEAAHQ